MRSSDREDQNKDQQTAQQNKENKETVKTEESPQKKTIIQTPKSATVGRHRDQQTERKETINTISRKMRIMRTVYTKARIYAACKGYQIRPEKAKGKTYFFSFLNL